MVPTPHIGAKGVLALQSRDPMIHRTSPLLRYTTAAADATITITAGTTTTITNITIVATTLPHPFCAALFSSSNVLALPWPASLPFLPSLYLSHRLARSRYPRGPFTIALPAVSSFLVTFFAHSHRFPCVLSRLARLGIRRR